MDTQTFDRAEASLPPTKGKTPRKKVRKMPFDLEQIFQSDADRFKNLKEVLKYLFDKLDKTDGQLETVESRMINEALQLDQ